MPPFRTLAAAALAAIGAAGFATDARAQDSADKVRVEAKVLPAEGIPAGASGRIEVTLTVEEGWHIYGPGDVNATAISIRSDGEADGLAFGEFKPTRNPRPVKVDYQDEPLQEFDGVVTYAAEVRVPADAKPGVERHLEGTAQVYACDAGSCLPTGKAPFRATLRVLPAGTAVAPLPTVGRAVPVPENAAEGGISVAFLLAAAFAGLLTIATPCVFPMIPLTVSLLTKSAEKEPGRVVPNALAYGAGMFVSLAGVGLAVTLLFGSSPTELTQTAWFNLAIFAFLMYLALSLFGAYDIRLPAFLTDWSQGRAGTGSGAGLFFMGMTLAFTSFACAAPFAGALLIRAKDDLAEGAVGMCVYAGSFTMPFFLLALFPDAMKRLPRSGGWLNAVKVVMGFVEVAAAFKFLRGADLYLEWGVFSRSVVMAVWVACSLGAAFYLLGLYLLPHDTRAESIGVPRLLWALLFLALAFYFVPGVLHRPLHPWIDSFVLESEDEPSVPWREGGAGHGGGGGSYGEAAWILNDFDRGLAEARSHGKPVFVDFTGLT